MLNSEHTGDASDEKLTMPLGLTAQVKLDDAILASPAVVEGKVYIADQMGTAYCIDPEKGEILWKTSPDGDSAMGRSVLSLSKGSNTSSPAIANGRIYYGTTAGNFHILNAADGSVVRTVRLGWPILAAPTFANGSIYFQALDGIVHSLDSGGIERWQWDPYKSLEPVRKRWPGKNCAHDRPHYSSNPIAVTGKNIVCAAGWKLYCLEDHGTEAKPVWEKPNTARPDLATPRTPAIANRFVYVGCPGSDSYAYLTRYLLADGSSDRTADNVWGCWAVFGTPAVRGTTVYAGLHNGGAFAYEFGRDIQGRRDLWKHLQWSSWGRSPDSLTPVVSSAALSAGHCLFTTLNGELIAVSLTARGRGMGKLDPKPFRFKTPHNAPISSSPTISGGRVFFGCDDGYLYVLGAGGKAQPCKEDEPAVHALRNRAGSGAGTQYSWPSPYGSPGNTNFADDPGLKPPFRLRWAVRAFGVFKKPVSAIGSDIISDSLSGLVTCREQATGRIRWRRQLPGLKRGFGSAGRAGILCSGERVYLPRSKNGGKLFCLDRRNGAVLWTAAIGYGSGSRAAPVTAGDVVAFGFLQGRPARSIVKAWDAESGKTLWEVELKNSSKQRTSASSGCAAGVIMIFSGGSSGKKGSGETLAIEAATGKVIWRTSEAWASETGVPACRDGRVYLSGAQNVPMACLSVKDGKVLWKHPYPGARVRHGVSLGPDFLTVNYATYAGTEGARRRRLADGMAEGEPLEIGGIGHGCGSTVLTSGGIAIRATARGLQVCDARTGTLLWQSLGFAPRACSNPIAASGRVFYNPQVSGTVFCFEPEASGGKE